MFSKRPSSKDQPHLWHLLRGSLRSVLHHKMPLMKSFNSFDSEAHSSSSSFAAYSVDSFDQDSPVFNDVENSGRNNFIYDFIDHLHTICFFIGIEIALSIWFMLVAQGLVIKCAWKVMSEKFSLREFVYFDYICFSECLPSVLSCQMNLLVKRINHKLWPLTKVTLHQSHYTKVYGLLRARAEELCQSEQYMPSS